MKANKQEIIMLLIVILAAYILINKAGNLFQDFFGTIGIGNTNEDVKREKEIVKTEKKSVEAFSPQYWKNPPTGRKATLIREAETQALIKQIYDGIGYFKDSPEKIIGVFRSLKYKTQVSWIADKWNKKYKSDLYTWLNDRLDTDDQRKAFLTVLSMVNKMPTGFIK